MPDALPVTTYVRINSASSARERRACVRASAASFRRGRAQDRVVFAVGADFDEYPAVLGRRLPAVRRAGVLDKHLPVPGVRDLPGEKVGLVHRRMRIVGGEAQHVLDTVDAAQELGETPTVVRALLDRLRADLDVLVHVF